ncbi:Uncharacterized protein ABC855_g496 [[Candida] zeylanoides]
MRLSTYSGLLVIVAPHLRLINAATAQVEVANFSQNSTAELQALTTALEVNNAENAEIARRGAKLVLRSDIPILDQILEVLKDTGLANIVIELVLLSPQLRTISTNVTISLLKSNKIDLTKVLISLQQSGLIISFLNLALDDPEVTVGLLRIGKELLKQFGFNLKRDEVDELALRSGAYAAASVEATNEPATAVAPAEPATPAVTAPKNGETDLVTELLKALNDSGLAMSVVQNLLTNPELSEPAAIFLADIIKSGALSISEILRAVKDSNIIFNLLRDILSDRALLEKFGQLIKNRIASGIISQEFYDSL